MEETIIDTYDGPGLFGEEWHLSVKDAGEGLGIVSGLCPKAAAPAPLEDCMKLIRICKEYREMPMENTLKRHMLQARIFNAANDAHCFVCCTLTSCPYGGCKS